ncbi:hypothetical protein ABIE41_003844 [Bosea sp. OAE506]|uniref:DUF4376 domain-containing protein n=1 Tax=Bosea sp. OAE506 TaxID=2663870 RepID=UPI00178B3E2D
MFDPRDHYWLAEDGRLFGSARAGLVNAPESDEAYAAWRDLGRLPTPWPSGDGGEQSLATLQAVLSPYGLFADLLSYARDRRWRAEVGGMTWNGVPIATDDSSKVKIAGARIKAQADPAFETTWYGADGEGVVVDAALLTALSDAVLEHVDGTFTTFGLVKVGIAAGAITTTAEIDAAFG